MGFELRFEERYFPAVTVCNLNPYKETQMNEVPEMKSLVRTTPLAPPVHL